MAVDYALSIEGVLMNAVKPWASSVVVCLTFTLSVSVAHGQTIPARALELNVGSGWGALRDDETNLGRGAPVAGGVAAHVGGPLWVSADIDWTHHIRDSGYLRAEGDLVGVFARATFLFGPSDVRIRSTVGAGVGAIRSTGLLTSRSIIVGPGGFPQPGPNEQSRWSVSRAAFEVHGGLRIKVSERLALRPEARFRSTLGSAASPGIEPPLLGIQTMVMLDVGL